MSYSDSFTWTSMPDSRPADSYLSYADGSVFLDFNHTDDIIRLIRISFDGYGCCVLDRDTTTPMGPEDSREFLQMYDTGIIEQSMMKTIITKTLTENQSLIWNDALREYDLLSPSKY